MRLYHVGFEIIKNPDIKHGRKNADFGQGFYLSPNHVFSLRWARVSKDSNTYINTYELDTTNLKIKEFKRDKEWFSYIFDNRNNHEDKLNDYDVIIGPIANDTIYNTWGILTSGLVNKDKALEVLQAGNEYYQVTIKTTKAANSLKFISAEILNLDEIKKNQVDVSSEESNYQDLMLEILGDEIKDILS